MAKSSSGLVRTCLLLMPARNCANSWTVIVLIAAEIAVAAINIVVDLYAGVD
jgi:hypothetical protein